MNPKMPATLTAPKATLYYLGGLGYCKLEVRDVELTMRAYAQFSSAIEASYVPKGKKTRRGTVQASNPSLVIVDGWGHPELPKHLVDRDPVYGDPNKYDFARYLADLPVLADYTNLNPYRSVDAQ